MNLIIIAMHTLRIFSMIFVFNCIAGSFLIAQIQPIGWASLNGSTIGGYGGDTVEVGNREEFLRALKTNGSRTILIIDTIELKFGERIPVIADNLSIMGKGDAAMIRFGGLKLYGNNIIVQNLSIGHSYTPGRWDGKGEPTTDALTIYGQNIWIDHCDLFRSHDGLLDFSSHKGVAADFVTVSWTRFSDHNKVMLIGSWDGDTICRGHFRITIHHCWFDGSSKFYDNVDNEFYRLKQRLPRVRYGDVHVFNNYYEDIDDYCIAARLESHVVVENNFFRNLNDAHFCEDTGKGIRDPELKAYGNCYENVKGKKESDGEAFNPAEFYDYTVDDPENIPAIVMNGAGKFNKKKNNPPIANNDTLVTIEKRNITIYPLLNDYDPDGDSIRISRIRSDVIKSYEVYPDRIQISPDDTNFQFPVRIEYRIIDFNGDTSNAEIYLLKKR
ncbi:MAG: hypothetical protein JXB24_15130 [Bacteroidales bacterium]|nr:hypothetical protein [Bacteroidales bacterium]